jgi:hypothetical protein
MELGKYNAFSCNPIYVPSPRYLALVETLLERKLESEDNAPLPTITVHTVDEPIERLPGDLIRAVEEEIRAKVFLALGSLPGDWESLGEDERVYWIEAAIEKHAGSTSNADRRTSPPALPSEPLTTTEYGILQQLARVHPQLIKIVDLAADLECRRSAASESLKRLKLRKLVVRPKGERSGYAITTLGLSALRPCDQPSHLRPHDSPPQHAGR